MPCTVPPPLPPSSSPISTSTAASALTSSRARRTPASRTSSPSTSASPSVEGGGGRTGGCDGPTFVAAVAAAAAGRRVHLCRHAQVWVRRRQRRGRGQREGGACPRLAAGVWDALTVPPLPAPPLQLRAQGLLRHHVRRRQVPPRAVLPLPRVVRRRVRVARRQRLAPRRAPRRVLGHAHVRRQGGLRRRGARDHHGGATDQERCAGGRRQQGCPPEEAAPLPSPWCADIVATGELELLGDPKLSVVAFGSRPGCVGRGGGRRIALPASKLKRAERHLLPPPPLPSGPSPRAGPR